MVARACAHVLSRSLPCCRAVLPPGEGAANGTSTGSGSSGSSGSSGGEGSSKLLSRPLVFLDSARTEHPPSHTAATSAVGGGHSRQVSEVPPSLSPSHIASRLTPALMPADPFHLDSKETPGPSSTVALPPPATGASTNAPQLTVTVANRPSPLITIAAPSDTSSAPTAGNASTPAHGAQRDAELPSVQPSPVSGLGYSPQPSPAPLTFPAPSSSPTNHQLGVNSNQPSPTNGSPSFPPSLNSASAKAFGGVGHLDLAALAALGAEIKPTRRKNAAAAAQTPIGPAHSSSAHYYTPSTTTAASAAAAAMVNAPKRNSILTFVDTVRLQKTQEATELELLRQQQLTGKVEPHCAVMFLPRGGKYVLTKGVGPIQFGMPPETIKVWEQQNRNWSNGEGEEALDRHTN